MVILNRPDTEKKILTTINKSLSKDALDILSKHTDATDAEIEQIKKSIQSGKVPVTLFVDCPSESNDIVLEARKKGVTAITPNIPDVAPKSAIERLIEARTKQYKG